MCHWLISPHTLVQLSDHFRSYHPISAADPCLDISSGVVWDKNSFRALINSRLCRNRSSLDLTWICVLWVIQEKSFMGSVAVPFPPVRRWGSRGQTGPERSAEWLTREERLYGHRNTCWIYALIVGRSMFTNGGKNCVITDRRETADESPGGGKIVDLMCLRGDMIKNTSSQFVFAQVPERPDEEVGEMLVNRKQ